MKFKYKRLAANIIRPIIPIELSNGDQTFQYEVLVDSGADLCIFDAQLADLLDIDYKSGRKGLVTGITGAPSEYFIKPISINVGGWKYDIEAGFQPNMPKFSYGVVGQFGFFNLFVVKFDYNKQEIELFERQKNKN